MSQQVLNIEREDLQRKLERRHELKLVMALSAHDFERKHIPGSIHFENPEAMLEAWLMRRSNNSFPTHDGPDGGAIGVWPRFCGSTMIRIVSD